MKATKDWGLCNCDCGEHIKPGDEMVVLDGSLYLVGHENNRRTRFIETIKKDASPDDIPKKVRKK
jgi:hypothetical protein